MARGVKAKTAEPARSARKPAPPSNAKAKVAAAKKPAAAARPSVTPARTLSKDALRAAQAEKLERADAALRTKSREANRAAKLSAVRMGELEGEVARLQTQLTAMSAQTQPAALPDSGSPTRDIGSGDAVPPGVAPADPEPADREAEIGREILEAHLRGDA